MSKKIQVIVCQPQPRRGDGAPARITEIEPVRDFFDTWRGQRRGWLRDTGTHLT